MGNKLFIYSLRKGTFFLFLALFANASSALAQTKVEKNASNDEYTYQTKFGVLQLIDEKNRPAMPAKKVTLNGKIIFEASTQPDGWGYAQSLMTDIFSNGEERLSKSLGEKGERKLNRLLLQEGPDGNCYRQFVILDFSGNKPFISERFGYNTEGKACLKFKRAKWNAKESYIYLDGPMKYVYYTGGRVIGPID